ncbi:hypothetical protein N7493_001836 [Penicillium malachiteum]|uniref:Uncharacterized protein n=1 Tax=Penicillium malachiteum TaxID=1324776 RepID=A0AAD6HUY9_9EURO|nr:hypothetical protein N7493_001836 [Penicillium malachiteum]
MIEAKTRRVEWPDVDGDTFARLCEFAYLRNYSPPSPSYITPPEEHGPCESPPSPSQPYAEPVDDYCQPPAEGPEIYPDYPPMPVVRGSHSIEIQTKYKKIQTTSLERLFSETLVITDAELRNESNYEFKPPRNTDHCQDFTPVFIGQARLYVLADRYLIESLRAVVLAKMCETLAHFKVYPSGIEAIVELVRFVYDNTPPNYGDNADAMRVLVTRFVVSVLGKIGESEAFQELLKEGGSFVADFWRMFWVQQ